MKVARLPIVLLPVIALAIAAIGALLAAMAGEAHVRGAYQVWQENETFAAAAVALAGDIHAYVGNAPPSSQHLKESIAAFLVVSPRELRAFAERPTINSTD